MSHSLNRMRRACVALLFVLVITAGFVSICSTQPRYGIPAVAAQASPASANTTVTNNVSVHPVSISLGSTLQAAGKVTAGGKPLANASVELHMGDVKLASAQTNAKGEYSFDVPVGVYYFPAAFLNGATIYTVVEPSDPSSISTPSAVTTLSVDLLPLCLIIVVITGAILVGLFLYTRRMSGKALLGLISKRRSKPAARQPTKPQPGQRVTGPTHDDVISSPPIINDQLARQMQADTNAEKPAQETIAPALPPESAAPLADEIAHGIVTQPPEPESAVSVAETGVLRRARDFFEQGNNRQAVNMLYDAAILDLVTTHHVTIASHATHWEKYHAIEGAVPEIQKPLRALTVVYELANYAGKALTEEQRNAAIDAFRAIKPHVKSASV